MQESSDLEVITEFQGEYRFLSNFWESKFYFADVLYLTMEHFYQSHKAASLGDELMIRKSRTPYEAKKLGAKVNMSPNWDKAKLRVMRAGVLAKFSQDPELTRMLLATGNAILIEGNKWHDNYWGSCYCDKCGYMGENHLGKVLMITRKTLEDIYV